MKLEPSSQYLIILCP